MNRQLEAQQIIMPEGRVNIMDAAPIEAAQSGPGKGVVEKPTKDVEAVWHVKQDSRPPVATYQWLHGPARTRVMGLNKVRPFMGWQQWRVTSAR